VVQRGGARNAFRILKSKRIFNDTKLIFLKVDQIEKFRNHSLTETKFDLALSSEVYQRLEGDQENYISNLKRLSKNFAIFAPNNGNESHTTLSGLKSVHLKDLLRCCGEGQPENTIYDYGFLDMPPFPPGLTRSKEKRMQAAESQVETLLMKGLEIYCLCEFLFPKFLKEKIAHITYVMVKNE